MNEHLKFETVYQDQLFRINKIFKNNTEHQAVYYLENSYFSTSESPLIVAYKSLFIQIFKLKKDFDLAVNKKNELSSILNRMCGEEHNNCWKISDYNFKFYNANNSELLARKFLNFNHVSIGAIIQSHEVLNKLLEITDWETETELYEELKILKKILKVIRVFLSKKINLF